MTRRIETAVLAGWRAEIDEGLQSGRLCRDEDGAHVTLKSRELTPAELAALSRGERQRMGYKP